MSERPTQDQYDETLREALQPVRLSPNQRQRHIERFGRALGRPERSAARSGGRLEFGVVALALLVVLGGIVIWSSLPDGDGSEDGEQAIVSQNTPTPLIAPAASATSAPDVPTESPLAKGTMPELAMQEGLESITSDACEVSSYAAGLPTGVPVSTSYPDWYGDPDAGLWAAPLDLGTLRPGLDSGGIRWFAGAPQKVQWYGAASALEIQGSQPDGGGSFEADPAASIDESAMLQESLLTIPNPGCWKISATADDLEFAFIIEALPVENRPDLIYLEQISALRPYETPASCPVTPFTDPQVRGDSLVFHYWMESGEIAIDLDQAWHVAQRDEPMQILGDPVAGNVVITARLQEDASATIQAEYEETGSGGYAVLHFPVSGCWEVAIETETVTETFTAYVYPPECAPDDAIMSVSGDCVAPQSEKLTTGFQA